MKGKDKEIDDLRNCLKKKEEELAKIIREKEKEITDLNIELQNCIGIGKLFNSEILKQKTEKKRGIKLPQKKKQFSKNLKKKNQVTNHKIKENVHCLTFPHKYLLKPPPDPVSPPH